MDQLLIFEYLHADAATYSMASTSMRAEGRAMLLALLADAAAISDLRVNVILCDSALEDLGILHNDIDVCLCPAHQSCLEMLRAIAVENRFVLPVAPECDELLLSVASTLAPLACTVLQPPLDVLKVCHDKFLTWTEMRHTFPMLDCQLVNSAAAELNKGIDSIYKPRLGAGCTGICRGTLPADADSNDYIRQPWIEGRSLSVALVSGGQSSSVLPVADQCVDWQGDIPTYRGGTTPASISSDQQHQISTIANHVQHWLGPFCGYIGIDLLADSRRGTVYLNEINPRICTSYVGYRQSLAINLLELMIGRRECPSLLTSHKTARFHSGDGFQCELPHMI